MADEKGKIGKLKIENITTTSGKVTGGRTGRVSGKTKDVGTTAQQATETPINPGDISPSLAKGVPAPIDLSKTPNASTAGSQSGTDTAGDKTKKPDGEEKAEGEEKPSEEGEEKSGTEETAPEGEEKPEGGVEPLEAPVEGPAPEGGEKPGPQEGQSEVSPSLKEGEEKSPGKQPRQKTSGADVKNKYNDLKNAWSARKGGGELAKEEAKRAVKKAAKELAKKALQWALDAIVAAVGWPVVLIIVAICLVLIILFAGLSCTAMSGYFGKTYEDKAGPDSAEVKKLDELNAVKADDTTGNTFHRFDYIDNADKDFVKNGKADVRLLKALAYISEKHTRIATSHIISAYQDMPGTQNKEQDPQLVANISAHKEGLASDISQIDFVYKVFEENQECQSAADAATGGAASASGTKVGDLVYYSDGSKEASNDIKTDGSGTGTNTTDTIHDSNGNTLSNGNLDATLDDLTANINLIFDDLNQSVVDTKTTVVNNNDRMNGQLNDEQKTYLSNLNNEFDTTLQANNNLRGNVIEVIGKIKGFNTKLTNARTTLDGLPVDSKAVTDLSKSISDAQIMILKAVQKIDLSSNMIGNLSDKLATDNITLNEELGNDPLNGGTIHADNVNIGNDLVLIKGISNINSLKDLNILIPNLDLASLATDYAIEQAKEYINDYVKNAVDDAVNDAVNNAWQGTIDNYSGQIGGLGGLMGGGADELLRLRCEGLLLPGGSTGPPGGLGLGGGNNGGLTISPNATYKGNANAEAIPIRVSWQDRKPNVIHVDNSSDEGIGVDPRVYSMVYQPEARKKVHQVIAELLQFPYDSGNTNYYRVTQLITYSKERDVTPFASILDKLYGEVRPANYGLFSMPEAWGQIHIGY